MHSSGLVFVGDGVDNLFDLVELVETKNSLGVLAISAHFTTEAGRDADHFDRKVFFVEDLILPIGGEGNLGGANESLTILCPVVIFLPPREIAGSPHRILVDHPRNGHGGEALGNHVSEGVDKDGVFEKNEIVFGNVGPGAPDTDSSFNIKKVEIFHNFVVGLWSKIVFGNLTPFLYLDISSVIFAKRHVGSGWIGNLIHQILICFFDLIELGFDILEFFFQILTNGNI